MSVSPAATASAMARGVRCSRIVRSDTGVPRAELSRPLSRVPDRLCPPNAKKSSSGCTRVGSLFCSASTSAMIDATKSTLVDAPTLTAPVAAPGVAVVLASWPDGAPSRNQECSIRISVLPLAVTGSSGTTSTRSGTRALFPAGSPPPTSWAYCSRTSSAITASGVSAPATTARHNTPSTSHAAASATPATAWAMATTSAGAIRTPLIFI